MLVTESWTIEQSGASVNSFKIDWTPFDRAGLTGSEKFHTAMLSWILSGECTGLTSGAHLRILANLTGLQISGEVRCIAESSPFDLLVQTEECLIVVENKLSSTAYSDQIETYSRKVSKPTGALRRFKGNRKPIGLLLSLGCEMLPSVDGLTVTEEQVYGEVIWRAVPYSRLLQLLQDESNGSDEVLQTYIVALGNLCLLLDAFLADHTSFQWVFENEHLKKMEKPAPANQSAKYIGRNNLESGFQIALLRRVLDQVVRSLHKRGLRTQGSYLGQSHGTGYFVIILLKIPNGADFLGYTFEKEFLLEFQYQGDTMKITFASARYKESSITDFGGEETRKAFFGQFQHLIGQQLKYPKLNKPRTKAYVSVSVNTDPSTPRFSRAKVPERLLDKPVLRYASRDKFVSKIVDECMQACLILGPAVQSEAEAGNGDGTPGLEVV